MNTAVRTRVADLLAHAAATLAPSASARLDGELLLAHVLGRNRSWLYAFTEREPDAASVARFEDLLAERRAGVPAAYLTGTREFWSLPLRVTPDVLIPRSETERLVELALALIPPSGDAGVLDLGTGSGAIALAIASERPAARILATDCSGAALAVAHQNARALGIDNVTFAISDWFAAIGPLAVELIVANPPYVAAGDPHLHRGDVRHEPLQALAAGADGLRDLRTIIRHAPAHLVPGGTLLVEHGWAQGAAVRGLYRAAGYTAVRTVRDLAGHPRATSGVRRA